MLNVFLKSKPEKSIYKLKLGIFLNMYPTKSKQIIALTDFNLLV